MNGINTLAVRINEERVALETIDKMADKLTEHQQYFGPFQMELLRACLTSVAKQASEEFNKP